MRTVFIEHNKRRKTYKVIERRPVVVQGKVPGKASAVGQVKRCVLAYAEDKNSLFDQFPHGYYFEPEIKVIA